ncbi:MAG: DUF4386 domain-containing protein [Bryobacteraceae bacterium]
MNSTTVKARSTGVLYLLMLIIGGLNLVYTSSYFVPGDAAATARKIVAAQLTYRLGIVSDIAGSILFIFLVLSLYALFKDVDKKQAMLMVILVSIAVAFSLVNLVNQIAPLILLSGADFLTAFTKPQLDALALIFLKLRSGGFEVVAAFWGLWLLPFGILVIRSRFFPTILGVLLIAASFAALAHSVGFLVLPAYKYVIAPITVPIDAIGELSIALWLLIKGAKLPLPE